MSAVWTTPPTVIADRYIEWALDDATIQTEAPSGVWKNRAEQGTAGRIIRYSYQQGRTAENDFGSLRIINNRRIYMILTYLVRMAGDPGDRTSDLAVGAARLDALLDLKHSDVTFTDGVALWSKHLAPWDEDVVDGDKTYPELGAFYEIAVQPNPA